MASVNSINEKIQNLITSAQAVTEDVSNDLTSQVGALIKGYGTGGIDTSSDTVAADKMLEGVTAHDASGKQITGTIPTYDGAMQDGLESYPKFQEKTVTANGEVVPDEGFDGLSKVVVDVAQQGISGTTRASGVILVAPVSYATATVVLPTISATSSSTGTIE